MCIRWMFKVNILNGKLEEGVYIEKIEGFQCTNNPDYVCRLKKDLYGLKKASRAWYARFDRYLQQQGFQRGCVDNNLYIKIEGENMLIVVVYVDDIMFGRSSDEMCRDFQKAMHNEFEMSMLGELSFFLGLQIV